MVSIYSIQYNKLDHLYLQYFQLKKYCKDEFTYIIINNGIDIGFRKTISDFCNILNITEIVIQDNDKINMTAMHHKVALQYCYDNYISKDMNDIRVVMDSDIIPFKDFYFSEMLGDSQISGIKMEMGENAYIASFISLFKNDVNLTNIKLDPDVEFDSGCATGYLVRKYKTKWLNHTAPIRKEESEYIFRDSDDKALKYEDNYGIQIIYGCLLHYYRGSGWDNGDLNFYERKLNFIKSVLYNPELYNMRLDENVSYQSAFMDQWIHKDVYPLYKNEN